MEIGSYISAAVAACSLTLNGYLAYLLRHKRTQVSRDDDMRVRLFKLKLALADTRLVDIAPHYEQWEYGFQSLKELRTAAVDCNNLLQIAPDGAVSRDVRDAVQQLVDDIKSLYAYRDSYRIFSNGKVITSQEKLSKWKDFEGAKHALSLLQTDYRKNIPIINSHLTNLH
ncbi:hypothetical protein CVM73_18625 [Bradyrhizobium forestalis]|uniref:Uncharacterized protein n=1 Tax=Bradyrhizobium forestalis TaxID=1419263 RepID=A0A2M8R7I7_9BRAD|nr:hypothetical protein [Bradyrhizobium forestalis]PJG53749.1 hypothetical protein CVM73_18625 [Bradyrhizobium forestalis]